MAPCGQHTIFASLTDAFIIRIEPANPQFAGCPKRVTWQERLQQAGTMIVQDLPSQTMDRSRTSGPAPIGFKDCVRKKYK